MKLSPLFALANREGPTLIECMIDRDDCTSDLISWGRLVAPATPARHGRNSRAQRSCTGPATLVR